MTAMTHSIKQPLPASFPKTLITYWPFSPHQETLDRISGPAKTRVAPSTFNQISLLALVDVEENDDNLGVGKSHGSGSGHRRRVRTRGRGAAEERAGPLLEAKIRRRKRVERWPEKTRGRERENRRGGRPCSASRKCGREVGRSTERGVSGRERGR